MSGGDLRDHAQRFLIAAASHPECRAGRIVAVDDASASIELDINVEMPLHMRVDGTSPNGVHRTETVTATLGARYPWSAPSFFLRPDFPRDLPHLQPDSADELPRPCLLDANPREYFFQFGLVEAGVFHLVHQLVLWLQRAAVGALIDPEQGWEPMLRRDLSDFIVLNAEACRAAVDRHGGHRVYKARYVRFGADDQVLGAGAKAWINVTTEQIPLRRDDKELFTSRQGEGASAGRTVCCLIWPDKWPDGKPFVADSYMPETITTLDELLERARELRCKRALRGFLDTLERSFKGCFLDPPVPVGIVLCARRPFHLIGSRSRVELLPYVVDIRAVSRRESLFSGGGNEPVMPAMQLDAANPTLLRAVSGAPEFPPVAMLGCGSVGSKMAMHLARSGATISVVSDKGFLYPHNMARHALAPSSPASSKADELAKEIKNLGQSPHVHKDDLVVDLADRKIRKIVLPRQAGYAVNTTASLAVREALSALSPKDVKPRLVEAALFGRGNGAFLLIEGAAHNPTLCDLVGELYATARPELRTLLFDPRYGLTEIQIGQGCSSLTMPMTDMRLSAMTAALTEELVRAHEASAPAGQIVVGLSAESSPDTRWERRCVAPFTVVDIEGAEGWTLRIASRVLDDIHADIACHPGVETGGLLIGLCSARLRAVTIVDVLPAPPDSVRSAGRFILGTEGMQDAIMARHIASGRSLFDVGTWHSHLTDQGPSPLDRKTAAELAAGRPPPSVLLIIAPNRLYALMHPQTAA